MWAFDLIELNGDDLRRDPLAARKIMLADLLARAAPGLRFNEHMDEDNGPLVFEHACKLGLEGIVSKRRDSPYSPGRSLHWIKSIARKAETFPPVTMGTFAGCGTIGADVRPDWRRHVNKRRV